MTIEISKEARKEAIHSIERYFNENMEEPIGNVAADSLLMFFLEEIGPLVYNKAVLDVQERLLARVQELGSVDVSFESANGSQALQAEAYRRVVAVLRRGGTTTACDAWNPFPPGSNQSVRVQRCTACKGVTLC